MTLEKHFVTNLTCLRDWGCGVFFNKQMQMLREKCLVFWHCSLLTKLQMFSISKQCWNVWIFFLKPPPSWTLKTGIYQFTVHEFIYLIFSDQYFFVQLLTYFPCTLYILIILRRIHGLAILRTCAHTHTHKHTKLGFIQLSL